MHWPTVPGEVLQSAVQRRGDGDCYTPWIEYTYSVAERRYQCDTVTYRGASSDRSAAESYVEQHPKGSAVLVFYDPESPNVAVLEPGANWRSYVLGAVVLLIFFTIGIAMDVAALM